MVIYGTIEIDGRTMARAKSDRGKYIVDGEGRYYADAVYPAGDPRVFTESEIDVDGEIPRPPVYDKYKLTLALERENLLEDFMSFISSDPVLAFKWNAANQLDYEDDMLSNALAAIKEALDVTDEQVAEILAEAEVG